LTTFRDFDPEKLFSKQLENISLNEVKTQALSETLSTTATSMTFKIPEVVANPKLKKNEST